MLLAAVLVVAAALRVHQLHVPTLSQPEIYVPGIALPDGVSERPPPLDPLALLFLVGRAGDVARP